MDKSIHSPEYQRLTGLLRQLRHDAGLRQVDLAEQLERPQSFVAKYEAGERRLDLIELRTICLLLGIGLGEFVQRFEEPHLEQGFWTPDPGAEEVSPDTPPRRVRRPGRRRGVEM